MKNTANNIILIGMPGSGKSTIGVLLAKMLAFDFVDTDLLLQAKAKKRLCDILATEGRTVFRCMENDLLATLNLEHSVIATGGSAVYAEDGMKQLQTLGKIVYIDVPFAVLEKRLGDFSQRGVVLPRGMTLRDLYEERLPLYEKYADIHFPSNYPHIEDAVQALMEQLA